MVMHLLVRIHLEARCENEEIGKKISLLKNKKEKEVVETEETVGIKKVRKSYMKFIDFFYQRISTGGK